MQVRTHVHLIRLMVLLLALAVAVTGAPLESAIASGSGNVVTWGYSHAGGLDVPPGLGGVTAVAGGEYHSLALKEDGTVVAWGWNLLGQTSVPADLNGVTAIAAGWGHNLAIKGDGTVVAWGTHGSGETTVPGGLTEVTAVAAGVGHSVALKSDGTVVAWGRNDFGQSTTPAELHGVTAIAAGYAHSLALVGDGTVVAWGSNALGETTVPVGLNGVTTIEAGSRHSLAVTTLAPDSTPPIITAPTALTVSATSPAGAVVSFAVTATDDRDPNPVVACTPPSGNTFPIGTTTVTCTATGAAGNSSSQDFPVWVKGTAEQLSDLIALVESFNLQQGVANSLDTKLRNDQDALEAARAGSLVSACNKLGAFVNEVEAQAGNGTLTPSQAEQLIAAAGQIQTVLGCP